MALPSEWTTEALVEEVLASPWRVPSPSADTRDIQRPGRGRALYQALVASRLAEAASRGLAIATSQARAETSGPILARLGFEIVCRFSVFTIPGPPG